MVNYKYVDLFFQDSIDKQYTIEYDGGTITNAELFSESIELSESLCSETALKFGCCESGVIKFKVANIMIPLAAKWITVSVTLEHGTDEAFVLGRYKVFSDKPTADRRYREIVAYDAMYDMINTDVAAWYNGLLPNADSTVTLKEFRTSFISYFGLEQEEAELINDNMIVEKTIEPEEISGKDVITAICEINGCFGHIGRHGKFQYIFLTRGIQGLYPADNLYPSNTLYPVEPKTHRISKNLYISCQYEDFVTKTIDKMQIRKEENDIGVIVGGGENCYIIQDNFLVYGKSSEELKQIANNVLSIVTGIVYRPFEAEVKGNPCFEVGDPVRLHTKYELVESYVLKRTLKGIQALKDTYETDGEEYYSEKVNSVHKSIIQLKGKTNVLERTIEETRSALEDVEKGLRSEIRQTASEIRLEVLNVEKGLKSEITQTASEIRLEVSETEKELRSEITQTASEVSLEVTNVKDNLQSQIKVNADNINLKVSKNGVISEINQSAEMITISAAKIDLQGLVSANEFTSRYATIDSLNVQKARIDNIEVNYISAGTVEANYATISSLTAVNGRLQTVEANYISAGTVKADYMEVANWTSSGYIKAGKINASEITVGTLSADRLDVSGLVAKLATHTLTVNKLAVNGLLLIEGGLVSKKTINGVTYLVIDDY